MVFVRPVPLSVNRYSQYPGSTRTRTFHGVCTSNAVNRYSQYPGSTRTRTFHGVYTSSAVNRYSQYPGSTRTRTFHGVCTSSAVHRYSEYPGSKFAMQSSDRVKTRCLVLSFSFDLFYLLKKDMLRWLVPLRTTFYL